MDDMIRRLKARRDGFSLEQPFYTDPDYFKLDEGGVIQFVDWYASFIGSRFAEGDRPALRSVA